MAAKKKEKTLEEAMSELEQVIEELEQEPDSLEESFGLYKKGMELLKDCSHAVEQVEKQMLVLNEEGETDEF